MEGAGRRARRGPRAPWKPRVVHLVRPGHGPPGRGPNTPDAARGHAAEQGRADVAAPRPRAPLPEPAATDRRGELQLVAQLGTLACTHLAMDLWRGTCGLSPMLAARVAPLVAGAALLGTPVDDDADAFLAGVFHVDVNHALLKRLGATTAPSR